MQVVQPRLARPVAVAAVALLPAALPLVGSGTLGRLFAPAVAVLLVVLSRGRTPAAVQRAVIGVAAATVAVAAIPVLMWPFPCLLAPPAIWAVARRRPCLRPALAWLRRGRLSRGDLLIVLAIAAASAVALVIWIRWADPEIGPYLDAVRGRPSWVAAVAVAGFATVNALGEELMFRGLLQSELTPVLGPAAAVACQALGFGFLHWHGIPSGWTGVVMATGYGGALGLLRQRSGGLLAAWTAHVAADTTIGIAALTLVPR